MNGNRNESENSMTDEVISKRRPVAEAEEEISLCGSSINI